MALIEKRTTSKGEVRFRVRVRLRGHPQEMATFRKISEAKLWAQQTEAAIRERRYFKSAEARRRTLAELVDRYVRDILPYKSTSLHFLKGQRMQLNWWKAQLGDYLLCDITPSRIVETRAKLRASPATINRYMAALSHMFTVAVREWEWMDDTPMRKISKMREPRGRVRYLTDEERIRLLAAAEENPILHLVIILALATGARKGELLNLRWSDVDLTRGRLTFEQTKNGERRRATLTGYSAQQLSSYRGEGVGQGEHVFAGRHGAPARIDREFRDLLRRCDIQDFRFHDLRHCAASYLAMNGASLNDIAEVLGHKTLSMVKRYTHLSETHVARVVERMNSSIFENTAAGL